MTRESAIERKHASGWITTGDGVRLYYEVHGDGAEVAIIPLAFFMRQGLTVLAARRRLIFYDIRGRGWSDPVASPDVLGLDRDVEDLETVRAHFGIGQVATIGFSYLGAVAALHAARFSGVSRVVQLGSLPPRRPAPYLAAMEPSEAYVDASQVQQLEALDIEESDPVRHCRLWWAAHLPAYTATREAAGRLLRDLYLGCDLVNEQPAAFLRTIAGVFAEYPEWDWRAEVKNLSASLLVLHGEQDHVAPLAGGVEWVESVPNGRIVTVPNTGHLLWAERPRPVLSRIDEFLSP
jgi:pimeloyl-ACP methyl ester carboxylesterase